MDMEYWIPLKISRTLNETVLTGILHNAYSITSCYWIPFHVIREYKLVEFAGETPKQMSFFRNLSFQTIDTDLKSID